MMLRQKMSLWLGLCLVGLTSLASASQMPPSLQEDAIFDILNYKKDGDGKVQPTGTVKNVTASHACLCTICLQPLYKHSDEGFECLPRDKEGNLIAIAKIESKKEACPVCDKIFVGALRSKTINDDGGSDADFCVHSVSRYSIQSKVWMCPDCGYAGLIEGWGKNIDGTPVSAASKEFVTEKLRANTRKRIIADSGINLNNGEIPEQYKDFSSYVLQTELPDWIKYNHALQIYEQSKLSHGFMATMYLDAAHACRREVCREISVPGLDIVIQKSLGDSIRRMNRFLQSECMGIRRKRGDTLIDPTKTELDQKIVVSASQAIIRQSDEIPRNAPATHNESRRGTPDENAYLRTGDMYVLYLRMAGAYDRLGQLDAADAALDKGLTYVPEHITVNLDGVEDTGPMQYLDSQLARLRGIITDRKECLRLEREYLFKAARSNLAALKFKELPIKKASLKTQPDSSEEERSFDPAPTAYLLGEIFRRTSDPAEAAYFYGIADRVLAQYTKEVEVASQALGDSIRDDNKDKFHALDELRLRWERCRDRNDQQRTNITSKKEVDPYVKNVGEMLLTAVGMTAAELNNVTEPATPTAIKVSVVDTSAKPNTLAPVMPPEASAKIKTRSELYVMYTAALKKYRESKNVNPSDLKTLVDGGFVPAADSCLDTAGKLWCPETQPKVRLQYQKNWEPDDAETPVIYPIGKEASGTTLFANGEIRQGLVKK